VNYVSFFDSARFVNWLHNGQPSGGQNSSTTEDGAYTFSDFELVGARNPNARIYLPNEHEWQKAAFYEPGVVTENGDEYWRYPTRSDQLPLVATVDAIGNITNPGSNTINYSSGASWGGSTIGNVTTVGGAGNETYYGAADMGGNVFEWVEADPTKPDPLGAGPYLVRGSGFVSGEGHLRSSERNDSWRTGTHTHNYPNLQVGFRIAAPAPLYEADFNEDDSVDGRDLQKWKQSFGGELFELYGNAQVSGEGFLDWQRSHNTELPAIDPSPANLDGIDLVDGEDMRLWQQAYVAGNSEGDVDGDGDTDGADFLAIQRHYTNFVAADKNKDRLVDSLDLEIWQRAYGYDGVVDTDGDGRTTGSEFLQWQREFTNHLAVLPTIVAVPEPTGDVLLSCLVMVIGSIRWQRL
jgi:hypothetical protein